MPEGVEVKIIAEQLQKYLAGQTVVGLDILGGRYSHSTLEGHAQIVSKLPLQIQQIDCKGKFLYWALENNNYLLNTLGMTGQWSHVRPPHAVLEVRLASGSSVFFADLRRFGTLKFADRAAVEGKLSSLGPDLLQKPGPEVFAERLRTRSYQWIGDTLMNQQIVSGVGNYIKAEALFRAKINPKTKVIALSDVELHNLYAGILEVMTESYANQGASLKDYVHLEGKGNFAPFFKVYKQERCPEGHPIQKAKLNDGRTTWYCSVCQIR